jgi:tRNA(adenine34) deaminase
MAEALREARRGGARGEVPVGAVVVSPEGEIVARAHNRPVSSCDPCAHAEILALRKAGRKLGNYRLPGCRLVVTVEPCPMCAGAALHARVAEIVYGADDPKAGALRTLYRLAEDPRLNHRAIVGGGVLAEECSALLVSFFRSRRREGKGSDPG